MKKLLLMTALLAPLATAIASAPARADDNPTAGWPPDVTSIEFDRDGNRIQHLVDGGRREYRKDGSIWVYDKNGKMIAAVAPVAVAPPQQATPQQPKQTTPEPAKPVTGFTDPEERKRIEKLAEEERARKKKEDEEKKKAETPPPNSEGIFDEHFRKIHEAEKKLFGHKRRAGKHAVERETRTGEKLNTREKRGSRTVSRSFERGRSLAKDGATRMSAGRVSHRAVANAPGRGAARLGTTIGKPTITGGGMMGNRMPMGRMGGGMGGFRPGGMGSMGRMRMGMR